MKNKLTLFLLVLSFMFLQWSVSDASIVALRTSPDNTRAVFAHLNGKQIFGLMIWAESLENSSFEGKLAIGSVALERNDYYRWGIKKICLQPRSFSRFNPDGKRFQLIKKIALNFDYYSKRMKGLQECYLVAEMLLNGSLPRHKLITNYNVKHFAAINCENGWTCKMTIVAVLDGHKFLV
jgi:Cell Wall Hydrolase.